ncbi:MAG TPA: flagellar motor protein MotB [Armatimonadota bacterium]|nr:flagellar motor protein MotB [Armatimonadota bacterium]
MAGRKKSSGGGGGGGHDGGGSLRWMLTYCDMITLLMAFFIMMYSMSVLDLAKFQQTATSLRQEFGQGALDGQGKFILNGGSKPDLRPSITPFNPPPPKPGGGKKGNDAQQAPPGFRKLETYLKEKHLNGVVRVWREKRGLVISLSADGLLFPAGSAHITPSCRGVLERLADAVSEVSNEVRVEGHTCDLPPRSGEYPSNWELSTARATSVIRYFIETQGVSAQRLSAAGYAASRPVVPNDNEHHRALNRRVDIVILNPGSAN